MKRIRLIHWNATEAEERAATLRAANYTVVCAPIDGKGLRVLLKDLPAAVVIDLCRLPSQGRDVGVILRKNRITRRVPLVFVGGAAEKVEPIRKLLPDAVFAEWSRIRSALKHAMAHAPTDPVSPDSVFAAYSDTPLPKKLGINAGSTVILVNAPDDFETTLGDLPGGVSLRRHARGRNDLVVFFTQSQRDLERRIEKLGALAGKGGLWIVWPKKSSGVVTNLTQATVRATGLATGLVDYKVCAVDKTWTGLRFALRKRLAQREKKR